MAKKENLSESLSPGMWVEVSCKEKEDYHWRGLILQKNTTEYMENQVVTTFIVQWFNPTGEPVYVKDHYAQELRKQKGT